MTTERKIEIVECVMKNNRLGNEAKHGVVGIYDILSELCNIDDYLLMSGDIAKFSFDSGELAKKDSYHHSKKFPKSQQVRINFLSKYIEHLKAQENERQP